MLPKKLRLSRSEVAEVFSKGGTAKSRLFIMRATNKKDAKVRFATVVSSKIDKRAAKRNKLRRQIQESIRKNLDLITDLSSIQLVIIPKKLTIDKTYQEIEQDIINLLQNLKTWANTLKTSSSS